MASKSCHQPRITTFKSNFANHDWKSQEKNFSLGIDQVPSLRNIILISEESKPGTVRFDKLSPSQFSRFIPFKCSHKNFSAVALTEKRGQLHDSKKRFSGSRTWWGAPGRGRPRWWQTLPIRSGWTMPAIFRCGERKRDIDINHIFVLDIIAVLIFSSSHLEQRATPRASPCPTTT